MALSQMYRLIVDRVSPRVRIKARFPKQFIQAINQPREMHDHLSARCSSSHEYGGNISLHRRRQQCAFALGKRQQPFLARVQHAVECKHDD